MRTSPPAQDTVGITVAMSLVRRNEQHDAEGFALEKVVEPDEWSRYPEPTSLIQVGSHGNPPKASRTPNAAVHQ